MIVLTPEEMAKLDQKVIDNGYESLILMETAGRGTFQSLQEKYDRDNKILILAGSGNNGGDGLVIGRLLDICKYNVKIIIVGNQNKLNKDPLTNYKICELRDMDIQFFEQDSDLQLIKNAITESDVIVDSLLGTGLKGDLRSPYLEIVKMINDSKNKVLAVDIPSGINGRNGQVMKEAVKADYTVTMAFSKIGHHLYPGRAYTGELQRVDLGFPEHLIEYSKYKHHSLTLQEAGNLLPKRAKTGHKGSFGKVLVIGGSKGLEGAPALSGKSALKMGTGLVKTVIPSEISSTVSSFSPELISDDLTIENIEKDIKDYDVIALGPGLGIGEFQKEIVSYLINKAELPIVIDADGLNNLNLKELKNAKSNLVLTPHPGEFARLIGKSIPEVQANRLKYVREFVDKYKVNLVLKGASSLVSDPAGNIYINPTGNEGMATAGSGDVLTGIISSLIGQGLNTFNSAVLGVYLHGLAGDISTDKLGSHSVVAQNLIENIPPAISKIKRGC